MSLLGLRFGEDVGYTVLRAIGLLVSSGERLFTRPRASTVVAVNVSEWVQEV
jgi:hypothetical protein